MQTYEKIYNIKGKIVEAAVSQGIYAALAGTQFPHWLLHVAEEVHRTFETVRDVDVLQAVRIRRVL